MWCLGVDAVPADDVVHKARRRLFALLQTCKPGSEFGMRIGIQDSGLLLLLEFGTRIYHDVVHKARRSLFALLQRRASGIRIRNEDSGLEFEIRDPGLLLRLTRRSLFALLQTRDLRPGIRIRDQDWDTGLEIGIRETG